MPRKIRIERSGGKCEVFIAGVPVGHLVSEISLTVDGVGGESAALTLGVPHDVGVEIDAAGLLVFTRDGEKVLEVADEAAGG